jgi:hypothetical protein
MRRFVRDNSLSLFFGVLLLSALVGQAIFLAVGSMAVFAIYLRQRGSPESKPVGAAHEETGVTG